MRTTIAPLFALVACVACSPPPDAPDPQPILSSAKGAIIVGSIVDEAGVCIEGAVAEIVGGPAVGTRIRQITPCDSWSDLPGFTFSVLTPGDRPTIRATADGYVAEERTVTATSPAVAYVSFGLLKAEAN
jgi:hypothetical protein